ncbi:MAG: hypothetical protein CM15mP54_28020 [Paracoccaceae bacterium]|nr:MAG: hypothetical protein CM15mP54_28020 [Paracoccaceae bacterium]
MLAYLILAKFFKPLNCTLGSVGIWVLLASSLYQFNFNLLQAVFFFGFSTIVTRYVGSFFVGKELVEKKSENDLILFLRAVVGGVDNFCCYCFCLKTRRTLIWHSSSIPDRVYFNFVQYSSGVWEEHCNWSCLFCSTWYYKLGSFCVAFAILLQMVPLIYVLVISLFGSVFVTALMLILDTKVKNQH